MLKNTHIAGDPIFAVDVNDMGDAIVLNEHNIFELALENYFGSLVTPVNGMFFDGFSDTAKADTSGGNITSTASSGQADVSIDDARGLVANQEVDIFEILAGFFETKIIQSLATLNYFQDLFTRADS